MVDHTHDGTSGSTGSYREPPKKPSGWQRYWGGEMAASNKMLRKFHNRGHRIVDRYLDEQRENHAYGSRLNLFHSNIQTIQGLMYGQLPKVDVKRAHSDANDDAGRVAALILGRILNNCVAAPGDTYRTLLKDALQDRLVPGLGAGKIRYDMQTEVEHISPLINTLGEELSPAVDVEVLIDEDCPTTYTHWQDIRWSYCRVWSEMRWIGFRNFMTYTEVRDRWGEEIAKTISYKNTQPSETKDNYTSDSDFRNPEPQAEVWEIWNKETQKVHYWAEGLSEELEQNPDPLGLSGFWPCPPFLIANPTTTLFVPKADFLLSQDLYNEIDTLTTRINIITDAVKVVGVYDASSKEVRRVFEEGVENELIPVDTWAMFGEKGGLAGAVDWLPVLDIVTTLDKLREIRQETIGLLYQVTGMSDIMRGQSEQYTSASSDKLKVQFGSARMQSLQEQFAEFATNLMKLKAEIISLHYDPQTIAKQANVEALPEDPQLIQEAIQLIKVHDMLQWKIQIRPESIAMVDYAQMQAERTEYLNAVATFMQSSGSIIEKIPQSTPFLMELLKWGLAGFKGAQEIEGVLDQALDQAKNAPPKQGNPEAEKAQAETQKIQLEMQRDQQKHQMDMQELAAKHQFDVKEIMAELQTRLQEIAAESDSNIRAEESQAAFNIAELRMKDAMDSRDHDRNMELQRAKAAEAKSKRAD